MAFPGDLVRAFPRLTPDNSRQSSDPSLDYNCIAWAAHDTAHPWWPDDDGIGYWPPGVPREVTLDAFVSAYKSIGYCVCENGDLEEGIEKVALYADMKGRPTHAARQLPNGKWTSKLGTKDMDIEHDSLSDVAGHVYGQVVSFLGRRRG